MPLFSFVLETLLSIQKTELRNDQPNVEVEISTKIADTSVPIILDFDRPEDLLALLMSGPPTKTFIDTEADRAAASAGHRLGTENLDPEMLRRQNIAKLKHQLAELDIKSDEELFKSACLK